MCGDRLASGQKFLGAGLCNGSCTSVFTFRFPGIGVAGSGVLHRDKRSAFDGGDVKVGHG